MSGLVFGWSRDETIFAIAAILIMASGTLGIDKILFRPKRKPRAPQKERKHRVSFVVEEVVDQDAKDSARKR